MCNFLGITNNKHGLTLLIPGLYLGNEKASKSGASAEEREIRDRILFERPTPNA